MSLPLSDTPRAPKLVPQFAPQEIVEILASQGPDFFQVVIESPDDGSTSHLVGPFADADAAQAWADGFIGRYDYDLDFVRVSSLWELTAPDSPEIDEFYG